MDDTESENGLDHIQDWDLCFQNDGDPLLFQANLDHLIQICQNGCHCVVFRLAKMKLKSENYLGIYQSAIKVQQTHE